MLQYFKSLTTNPVLHQDYNLEQFDCTAIQKLAGICLIKGPVLQKM